MSSNGKVVLVVDDDVDFVETLALVLESRGYAVEAATTAQSALERLDRGLRPSLILLDLMMPDMHGWEFRERLLQRPELASIPVVVLSGDHMALRRGPPPGCQAALPKPVDLGTLVTTVAQGCQAGVR